MSQFHEGFINQDIFQIYWWDSHVGSTKACYRLRWLEYFPSLWLVEADNMYIS